MMAETDQVIHGMERLEKLLRVQYHAHGDNLQQLIESSEERLPHDAVTRLKRIESIHRKLDGEHYTQEDCTNFMDDYRECMKELLPRSGRFIWRTALVLMMLITLAAMVFYYLHWDILSMHLSHTQAN